MPSNNTTIGSVRAVLGADTAQFETALNRAGGALNGLAAIGERTQARLASQSKALQQVSLGLSRQFTDIGVQLAGGQSPFLVLTQQLPQIADQMAVAKMQGLGFKDAVKGIGGGVATALPALAAVGAAVGASVGAFALFERAVDKQTKGATTFGETWQATLNVIGREIMEGPIGTGLKWLSAAFGKVLDGITSGVTWFLDKLVGHFGAAYQLVVKNWQRLPEVFGVIAQGAANITIQAVEGLVNKIIEGTNYLLKKAGQQTIGFIDLPEVRLANRQLAKEYDALATQISGSFRQGRESFFGKIVAETDRLHIANQKATKSGKDHGDALKKVAKEADAAAESYKALTARVVSFTDALREGARDFGLSPLQKQRRDLQEGLADLREWEQGLQTTRGAAARLNAEVKERTAEAIDAVRGEIVLTVPALDKLGNGFDDLDERLRNLSDAFADVKFSIGDMFRSLKSGDLGGFALNLKGLFGGIRELMSQGPAGFASLGSIVANTIGGKTGRAVGGGLGIAAGGLFAGTQLMGAASMGLLGSGALAGGAMAIAPMLGPIGLAVGAIYALSKVLGPKPTNAGAGYDLRNGAISGNKRTSETEAAARQTGEAILAGQAALESLGAKLGVTVDGVVLGTRDLSQVYLSNGQMLKTAVGDAQAAADAGLKAVLQSATFADEGQKKLVDNLIAAGKSFNDVLTALDGYAQAQKISGNIADRILQITDPKAFDLKSVKDAIAAERDAAKAAADAGYLTAEQLTAINAQLSQLEALQLDEVLKRYGEAVDDAATAAREAAQAEVDLAQGSYDDAVKALEASYEDQVAALTKTRDRLLEVASGLADFRNELRSDLSAGGDPTRALAAARTAFAAAAASGDPERLAKLPELGKALIAASEAGASSAQELRLDKAAVLRATTQAETAARAQASAIDQEIAALNASVAGFLSVNENLKTVGQALADVKIASDKLELANARLEAVLDRTADSIDASTAALVQAANDAARSEAAIAQVTQSAAIGPIPDAAATALATPPATAAGEDYQRQIVSLLAQQLRIFDDVTQGGDSFRTSAA